MDNKEQGYSRRFSSLAPENTDGILYETKLPWKKDHVQLPTNRNLSVARHSSTTRKSEKTAKLRE